MPRPTIGPAYVASSVGRTQAIRFCAASVGGCVRLRGTGRDGERARWLPLRAGVRDGGLLRRPVAVAAVLGVGVHSWIASLAGVGPRRLPGPSREAIRNAELIVDLDLAVGEPGVLRGRHELAHERRAWLWPSSAMRHDAQNRARLRPPSGVSATVRARASGRHPVGGHAGGRSCGAGRGGSRNWRSLIASTGFAGWVATAMTSYALSTPSTSIRDGGAMT